MRRSFWGCVAIGAVMLTACGPAPSTTGYRSLSRSGPVPVSPHIVKGTPLVEAPSWAVYVETEFGPDDFAACTGSLISPVKVLTAAHCVENSDGTVVAPAAVFTLVGAGAKALDAGIVRGVTKVDVHPQRMSSVDAEGYIITSVWDFAVLTLNAPVNVQPIALTEDLTAAAPGPVVAYGYGLVEAGTPDKPAGTRSEVLRRSPDGALTIVSCPADIASIDVLCLGSTAPGTSGIAAGDSGGPWVRISRGGAVQVALASYGSVVDPEDAVGANVFAAMPWIRETAGLFRAPAGTVLRDTGSGMAWRVQSDGYRKFVPDVATLTCLTQAGAPLVDKPLRTIQQIPEAVGENDVCGTTTTTTVATTTTTAVPTTTAAPTTVAVTTTVPAPAVPVAATRVQGVSQARDTGTADLAATGGNARQVAGGALLLVGAGVAIWSMLLRRRDAQA